MLFSFFRGFCDFHSCYNRTSFLLDSIDQGKGRNQQGRRAPIGLGPNGSGGARSVTELQAIDDDQKETKARDDDRKRRLNGVYNPTSGEDAKQRFREIARERRAAELGIPIEEVDEADLPDADDGDLIESGFNNPWRYVHAYMKINRVSS